MSTDRQRLLFSRRLRTWYRRRKRQLPWRSSRDPYRVWLSEIMLQQTQVATVVPYFERFVAALPSIADLAAANEETVLRMWEGLGYYRRARHLHQAAKTIVREHGGVFPRTMDDVTELPGIGRYTAGAILSIAFGQRHPILEANTRRLYARLSGLRGDLSSSKSQRTLWQFAENLLPRRAVGEFNQALMELGALVCTPREPKCRACPVAHFCIAKRNRCQEQIPGRAKRQRAEKVHEAAVAVLRQGRVLLLKRLPHERWSGLWDFLRFACEPPRNLMARNQSALSDARRLRQIEQKVAELTGVAVQVERALGRLKHTVTRFSITLDCFVAAPLSVANGTPSPRPIRWVPLAQLEKYPLSTTARKLARWITQPG